MFAALYLPPLPGRAADAHARLMAVAREFSPRVERLSEELLALDVSGLERWFENSRALAGSPVRQPHWGALGEQLRHAAADRGLAAHVAVAATCTAAVLCARGRAGLTVAPAGEEAARLAPLPLDVLSAWTISRGQWAAAFAEGYGEPRRSSTEHRWVDSGQAPIATFRRWGLKTLGNLANLPDVEVSERLGQAGIVWQRLARGEDLQPLVPTLPDEHYEESLELEWPIEQLEPLSFVLGRLLDALCTRLEQADRGVAVLHVRLNLVGGQRFIRTLQLPAPMRDARTLRTLALLDLESNPPPGAIDRVTVAADVVEGRVLQFSLLARAFHPERLSTLLARLSALMGADRVGAPALVDSHRPGVFAMVPFEAGRVPGRESVRSSGRSLASGGAASAKATASLAEARAIGSERRRGAPRALKNDDQVAESSNVKSSATSALKDFPVVRRFRQPVPARVDLHQGRPVRVTSNRRHLRGGSVEVCAGPWRSSGDWWVSAWDRDEWDVAVRDGATYLIFQDRQRGGWFIDGILD